MSDRNMRGSTHGAAIRPEIASCLRSTDDSRLAFRFASGRGLSVVICRPSVVHVQLCASPLTLPSRDLISTNTSPAGVSTRRSTSFTRPSSSMNSKFDHARQGSWSGRWLRAKSSASRSHANALWLTAIQRGGFICYGRLPFGNLTTTIQGRLIENRVDGRRRMPSDAKDWRRMDLVGL